MHRQQTSSSQSLVQTFLDDFAGFIKHTLHFTSSHVDKTNLRHKRLVGVVACTNRVYRTNSQQERNVVLPQIQSHVHQQCRLAAVIHGTDTTIKLQNSYHYETQILSKQTFSADLTREKNHTVNTGPVNDVLTFPFTLDFRSQVQVHGDVSADTCRVVFTDAWLGDLTLQQTRSRGSTRQHCTTP